MQKRLEQLAKIALPIRTEYAARIIPSAAATDRRCASLLKRPTHSTRPNSSRQRGGMGRVPHPSILGGALLCPSRTVLCSAPIIGWSGVQ